MAVDLPHSLAAKVVEVGVHELGHMRKSLRLRQHIEVEVGAAARRHRHLAPRVAQDPSDEVTSRLIIEGVLRHPTAKESEVIEKIKELLPSGAVGAKQVALHYPSLHEHKGGLRLNVGVVAGQVVGKELAIFKDRVDRLAEKSGFAAEASHRLAVLSLVAPDDDLGFCVACLGC